MLKYFTPLFKYFPPSVCPAEAARDGAEPRLRDAGWAGPWAGRGRGSAAQRRPEPRPPGDALVTWDLNLRSLTRHPHQAPIQITTRFHITRFQNSTTSRFKFMSLKLTRSSLLKHHFKNNSKCQKDRFSYHRSHNLFPIPKIKDWIINIKPLETKRLAYS